ncbi:MAG: hypothetical protein GY722_16670, partial [bacterium]|nr:hypothetical protein [bacterium]
PQLLANSIATATDMEVLDLRPALRSTAQCPYQPGNMHWLEAGHEAVTKALFDHLDL